MSFETLVMGALPQQYISYVYQLEAHNYPICLTVLLFHCPGNNRLIALPDIQMFADTEHNAIKACDVCHPCDVHVKHN